MVDDVRRRIPRTDAVLGDPRLAAAVDRVGRDAVKQAVVTAQQAAREGRVPPEAVADLAVASLPEQATTLRQIINATGVVLHTNLGRAPLSTAAVDALALASGYVDIEYDTVTGRRARRGRGMLEALAAAVPAAEDVHVVNNGAAALVLAATALAAGKYIVVSRGEMVEIGDGFRLPDLLVSTGARLREVGTTNRTTLRDYAEALDADVGFVLKVHPSNFVLRGFAASVAVADLADLDAPIVVDIGSGLLAPDPLLPDEPDAATTLRAGAMLVTASADKLLGGPQGGLLLGRGHVVQRLRRHPLARALRVDKLTSAALEATLRGPRAPIHDHLHADADVLRARADAIIADLRAATIDAQAVPSPGVVGGGGAPAVELAGWAVSLPEPYAAALRAGRPSVVTRVEDRRCLVDLRCVPPRCDADLVKAVLAV